VIDSAFSLPDDFSSYDVLDRERFLDTDENLTQEHGREVFDILSYFAPGATYYLYQAVDEDGEIALIDFADAVEAAVDENVDIINLSAGDHRPNCIGGACGFCRVAKSATQEDIIFVAAAGNSQLDGGHTSIHCPAFADPVISIGGYEALCTFEPEVGRQAPTLQNSLRPPLAYWTEQRRGYNYPPGIAEQSYCSGRDCGPDGSCDQYREFQEWPHNPTPAGSKPDILAPIHYVSLLDRQTPYIMGGSSYGAPIVSGAIAWALGLLLDNQLSANPYQVQQAIRQGADSMPDASADRFNATKMLDQLL